MKSIAMLALALVCSTQASSAFAWGKVGHAVIADRAESMLTPTARSQVRMLLDTLGESSLANIASWADDRRNRAQGPWHYVNLPAGDCHYVRERDCPDGQCLIEQVRPFMRLLANKSADTAQRANALIYIVHFAGGDSSQPLHSGMRADKGGNAYQVRFDGRGTNLHALWDSGLIYEIAGTRSTPAAIQAMRTKLPAFKSAVALKRVSLKPESWIEQSCRVWNQPQFYPPGHVVDDHYVAWASPVLLQQLDRGSQELAAVLNSALGGGQR